MVYLHISSILVWICCRLVMDSYKDGSNVRNGSANQKTWPKKLILQIKDFPILSQKISYTYPNENDFAFFLYSTQKANFFEWKKVSTPQSFLYLSKKKKFLQAKFLFYLSKKITIFSKRFICDMVWQFWMRF